MKISCVWFFFKLTEIADNNNWVSFSRNYRVFSNCRTHWNCPTVIHCMKVGVKGVAGCSLTLMGQSCGWTDGHVEKIKGVKAH